MQNKNLTALIDLDSMLHIIAAVQYNAGNRDNADAVRNHVRRFVANICTNSTTKDFILMYQKMGHQNFRCDILPEYKGHRIPSEAILKWKPTIVETYAELGAMEMNYIESDDAQSILAEKIGYDRTVIVTGDKDIQQVPTLFYNPYKKGLKAEDRWQNKSIYQANRFFWMQVLAGDPTDMPGELCGIEGVGMKTADKMCDVQLPFQKIIQNEYTRKYGGKAGFARANLTYKMVRLLKSSGNEYAPKNALEEVDSVLKNYKQFLQSPSDPDNFMHKTNALNLFN